MLNLPQYRGTTVGVLGLGPEGMACVAALAASGATVIAWDGRTDQQAKAGAKVLPPADWPVERLAGIFLADGVRGGGSLALVDRATAANVPVLNDLDLFGAAVKALPEGERPTVIAVTGAAGKSYTCSLIAHILRDNGRNVHVGGPIGKPLLALPDPKKGHIFVLELPIRRLATTRSLHADISVVLNVSSGEDADQVELALRSVLRVFKGQGPKDTAIIGVDDAMGQKIGTMLRSGQLASGAMGTVIPVSGESALGHGIFAMEGGAYAGKQGKTQQLGDFSRAPGLIAPFFHRDAAAAIATCQQAGVAAPLIIKSLHSYRGLSGRFECLGHAGRVIFVDDTFANCPLAVRQSVKSHLDVFWIGGDGVARADLAAMGKGSVHGAYLVGDARSKPDSIGKDSMSVTRYGKLGQAFSTAYADAVELAKSDPDASPMVLCAPGIPFGDGRFEPESFRTLALNVIAEEARYAS